MTFGQKIKMALAYKGMSEAALAREMGATPAAFNQRIKTGKFTLAELSRIAKILGGDFVVEFRFPDGAKV